MLGEIDVRVKLENAIRLQIRARKQGHDASKYDGEISAYSTVLEYDSFTVDCIRLGILKQEEGR